MIHQHATIEDTVYFWFASNDTAGSGDDGAAPAADVRLAGAAAGAIPVLSPVPILLTHANYPPGSYEVAVAATVANGFAATNTYSVFSTLLVDAQNPTGFIGSFTLDPIVADVQAMANSVAASLVDEVFDEDVVAAHGTADTAGLLLRVLGQGISGETHDADLLDQIKRVIAVIESQRGAHTHQAMGNIFFVDPVNGGTHGAGNRGGISDPYLGVQDCHDNAITDSNHDLIILLSGAAAGVTTLTEDVTLSKRYLFLRGPGRDFIWTRAGAGDTISITADGVELSGFQLNTAGVGSGNGIQVTDADFLRVHRCWINDTRGDGINLLRAENCIVENNVFTDTGQGGSGKGIDVSGAGGSSNFNIIRNNSFRDCQGDAIQISGGSTNDTTIIGNIIEGSTAFGIDIGASSTDAIVIDNRLANNASGNINDGGATTVLLNNEQWAKAGATADDLDDLPTVTEIVDGTLDEVNTGATHNVNNSVGKQLRQASETLIITSGTAQGAGANDNQIQLAAGASAIDGAYDPAVVVLVGGTGSGQSRLILQYDGATKMATVDRTWKVNPDDTSEYLIAPDPGREHVNEGLAQAGAANSITLNVLASSTDDAYIGQTIFIRSGLGEDQARLVDTYDGTTKIAIVHDAWDVVPDTTSGYVMLPYGNVRMVHASTQAIDEILTAQMTESYAAQGVAPTVAQALFLIQQIIGDFSISGTTLTAQKLDGVTTSATYTLSDSAEPTSRVRAT